MLLLTMIWWLLSDLLCMRKCLVKLSDRAKARPHVEHTKGLSPVSKTLVSSTVNYRQYHCRYFGHIRVLSCLCDRVSSRDFFWIRQTCLQMLRLCVRSVTDPTGKVMPPGARPGGVGRRHTDESDNCGGEKRADIQLLRSVDCTGLGLDDAAGAWG